jgi:hypothetical protein
MKKILLLLLPGMLFLAGNAEAQFEKGTKHWGTTISFSGTSMKYETGNLNEYSQNNHSINPAIQFGKFTKDNTMLGLRLTPAFSFNNQKQNDPNSDLKVKSNFMNLTLSPFIRRYKTLGEKWAIFVQPGLNISYLRGTTNRSDAEKDHDDGFGAGAYVLPGIVYRVTPRFALEADVNVLSLNLNYSNLNSSNNFGFDAGISSSIQQYFSIRASWYITTSN